MTLLEWMAVIAIGLMVLIVALLGGVLLFLWNLDSNLADLRGDVRTSSLGHATEKSQLEAIAALDAIHRALKRSS